VEYRVAQADIGRIVESRFRCEDLPDPQRERTRALIEAALWLERRERQASEIDWREER